MKSRTFVGIAGVALILMSGLLSIPRMARAQDAVPDVPDTLTYKQAEEYANQYIGQFTPGSGFDVIRTERGSLNISFYGLFRYLNQMNEGQKFTDHLGRERTVAARNDLNWHRS